MRAIVIHAPKDLRIEERETGAPGQGEVRVRLAVGGVCGSDLHYYNHGGFGAVRIREPMILGHEVSGHVEALGPGVTGLSEGDLVAISPSRPCGRCRYCAEGLRNHCLDMRFYGSAMPFPHIQGAFREHLVAGASQCVKAEGLSPGVAAMAEPLSVCLHAVRRAGEMIGKRVLITGCGPIGALAILAARRAGAAEIVVTDLAAEALAHGRRAGADRVADIGAEPEALAPYGADKGWFDVHFECSGAPSALAAGVAALRPRGVLVQVGMGGDMNVPMQAITAKEIDLRGAFRFHEEFAFAVGLMRDGLIDPAPLITHTMKLDDAEAAFTTANDRRRAMKTQIAFT
ncbi:L-idonate 5-dehydrogenase [Pikeienuella piscinae]|uniref:L-idonate 5-dehydrogenase n=1 Tax=Pikeienuella piscinae TaxID=2748098 RepID=A0A7M3T5X6_9RHOB|nr:L-idonate 5-dehydrogenase [Pikeienuella piscinae]QIE57407.1 L-idonate 5-dehydrogenase [Pikeienuella piscinae]